MTIPLAQIEQVLSAGHADDAIVGVPVSLLREFVRALKPVEVNVVSRGVSHVIGTNPIVSVGGRRVR